MKRVAIDASVVLAMLLDEPRPAWVDDAIEDAAEGRITLVAPSLLWIEAGNRLVRDDLSDEHALEGLLRLDALGIEPIEVGRPLRLRALQLARTHRLTLYDAAYLAVAEVADVPLLTLDEQLDRAATWMGLGREGGAPRILEPSAPHEHEPDLTALAAIGAALAEMRKQYAEA